MPKHAYQPLILNVNHINDLLDQCKEIGLEYKEVFEIYIVDKNFSLDERYTFWLSAPEFMKNTKSWVEDFTYNNQEISWYDAFHKERTADVYLHECVESLERDLKQHIEHPEWDSLFHTVPTRELVDDFREQVLAKNLYMFTYDW